MNEAHNPCPTAGTVQPAAPSGEITIPADMMVACPVRQFKLRQGAKCEGCEHFRGVADRFPDSDVPFDQRFLIACGGTVHRRLTRYEIATD